MTESLQAQHVLEYAYTRSVGPVIGAFLTGLRDGKIIGIRSKTAGVLVPPAEYDPNTGESLEELVEVSDHGVITAWAGVSKPRAKHPLQAPFAWALIKLDGADTSMLHAVDATELRTGERVQARWKAERSGVIQDIECFEPER
ncbi:MAG: OB-fold domain-containing protein [Actinomycetota bacterium]